MMTIRKLLLLSSVSLALAGCSSDEPPTGSSSVPAESADIVQAETSNRFPEETLRDWRSYADHVVEFTVTGEEPMKPSAETTARGEGLIPRVITIRVNNTLWSADNAPKLPSTVRMTTAGWFLEEGTRKLLAYHGAPRVEVGRTYVSPLVFYDHRDNAGWNPLTEGSQLQLDPDGRVLPDTLDETATPVRDKLAGMTASEIAAAVVAQTPDPKSASHANLRPVNRIQAVLAD